MLSPIPPSEGRSRRAPDHGLLQFLDGRRGETMRMGGRPVAYRARQTICHAGQAIDTLLFVSDGTASIIAASGVEVGMVGLDGLIGIPALLGASTSAQAAGAATDLKAYAVAREDVLGWARRAPAFHAALLRYAASWMDQAILLSSCNAKHTVEQRLARWVLLHLRTGSEIRVTHEQLAALFGVRRATITVVLHNLEGDGALRSRRGRLLLRDRPLLEARSCGCHSGFGLHTRA